MKLRCSGRDSEIWNRTRFSKDDITIFFRIILHFTMICSYVLRIILFIELEIIAYF